MHPIDHARSSQRKWGGAVADYLPLHNWFDASKAHMADWRHRAARHHSMGIFWAEEVFGTTITNSEGIEIPVRVLGEQHVMEDLGWIPTLADWLRLLGSPEPVPKKYRGVQRQPPITILPDGTLPRRVRRKEKAVTTDTPGGTP